MDRRRSRALSSLQSLPRVHGNHSAAAGALARGAPPTCVRLNRCAFAAAACSDAADHEQSRAMGRCRVPYRLALNIVLASALLFFAAAGGREILHLLSLSK